MTLVAHEADIFKINLAKFKRSFKFCEMSSEEMWKVNLVNEITYIQHSVLVLGMDADGDLPGLFSSYLLKNSQSVICRS